MIIKVDKREQELILNIEKIIQSISHFNVLKVITENLPLGDIIISNNEIDKLIIERKTVNDLLSSIKDGRYEEQSYRLSGIDHENHNIIYLIEGDINKLKFVRDIYLEKKTLYSAIFTLNYYKGFSVLRTLNIEETALFICNSAYKLIKGDLSNKNAYYKNTFLKKNIENQEETSEQTQEKQDFSEQSDKNYINVVKKVKKENITPENIDEIMLCQIPGISNTTSKAIIEKFKSLDNLLESIKKDINCMKDISYINAKGQSRKINKNCLEIISNFLIKKII